MKRLRTIGVLLPLVFGIILVNASCEENLHNVTYIFNDGVTANVVKKVNDGDKAPIVNIPARDSFVNAGWIDISTQANFSFDTIIKSDTTLILSWTQFEWLSSEKEIMLQRVGESIPFVNFGTSYEVTSSINSVTIKTIEESSVLGFDIVDTYVANGWDYYGASTMEKTSSVNPLDLLVVYFQVKDEIVTIRVNIERNYFAYWDTVAIDLHEIFGSDVPFPKPLPDYDIYLPIPEFYYTNGFYYIEMLFPNLDPVVLDVIVEEYEAAGWIQPVNDFPVYDRLLVFEDRIMVDVWLGTIDEGVAFFFAPYTAPVIWEDAVEMIGNGLSIDLSTLPIPSSDLFNGWYKPTVFQGNEYARIKCVGTLDDSERFLIDEYCTALEELAFVFLGLDFYKFPVYVSPDAVYAVNIYLGGGFIIDIQLMPKASEAWMNAITDAGILLGIGIEDLPEPHKDEPFITGEYRVEDNISTTETVTIHALGAADEISLNSYGNSLLSKEFEYIGGVTDENYDFISPDGTYSVNITFDSAGIDGLLITIKRIRATEDVPTEKWVRTLEKATAALGIDMSGLPEPTLDYPYVNGIYDVYNALAVNGNYYIMINGTSLPRSENLIDYATKLVKANFMVDSSGSTIIGDHYSFIDPTGTFKLYFDLDSNISVILVRITKII